jgi:predicted component of type VI protein secretion system
MPAQLLALSDGPSLLVDKPVLLLGRQAECDVQLNSRKVSRRHCVIAQINDYLVVRDLGSTNGIRINGLRVAEGRLTTGDELTVGNFRYQVQMEARSAPGVPTPLPMQARSDASLEQADVPVALDERAARGRILPARPAPGATIRAESDSFVLPPKLRIPETPIPPGR